MLCQVSAIVVFIFVFQISIGDVIWSMYDGSPQSLRTEATFTGAGSNVWPSVNHQKCWSNPCLHIAAGSCGTSCKSSWNPAFPVSSYNSLSLSFMFYHNGLGSDGTRECHFQYSCGGGTQGFYDFPGQSKLSHIVSMSNCDASGTSLYLKFECTGGNGNVANLFIDDFVLSGNPVPVPTPKPTKYPTTPPTTRNPTETPTKYPTKSPITKNPTQSPTQYPSKSPTDNPSASPSKNPVSGPSDNPSASPSKNPSISPTRYPTTSPITAAPTVSPITAAPTVSPITSSPSETPSKAPSKYPTEAPTERPLCKTPIDGNAAWVHVDPRFITWSGEDFHFHGSKTGDQYYYMYPCDDEAKEKMPFKLYGSHKSSQQKAALDYVTFEFDDNDSSYVLWFNLDIYEWMNKIDIDDTRYISHATATHLVPDSNEKTVIGKTGKFKATLKTINEEGKLGFSLTIFIEDNCELELNMARWNKPGRNKPGRNKPGSKTRGHFLEIKSPECYRCYTCGLLGDFNTKPGQQTFKGCNGEDFSWEGEDPWDRQTGWTWKKTYVDAGCQNNRRRLQPSINDTNVGNNTNVGNETREAFCNNETMVNFVESECKSARDAVSDCCDNIIGGMFCHDLQDICNQDACDLADGFETLIPSSVDEIFTNIVDFMCNIPDIGEHFKIEDLVWSEDEEEEAENSEPLDFLPQWLDNIIDLIGLGKLEGALIVGIGAIVIICCVCIGCCCCCRKKKSKEGDTKHGTATSVIEIN